MDTTTIDTSCIIFSNKETLFKKLIAIVLLVGFSTFLVSQNCERLYNGFGEKLPSSHKTVFVRFHVVRDNNGQNNFSETAGKTYIENVIADANSRLANNQAIFPYFNSGFPFYDNSPPPVKSIQIDVQLKPQTNDLLDPDGDGVYFYNNTAAWCVSSEVGIHNYIKQIDNANPGVINVFLLEDCCLWNGASACAGSGYSIVSQGYVMLYSAYKTNTSSNALAGIFNHELFHLFNLAHTFEEDACSDTPVNLKDWCGTTHCNNIMDYNCEQTALSPEQIDRLHAGTSPYIQNGAVQDNCISISYPSPSITQSQVVSNYTELLSSMPLPNTQTVWELMDQNQKLYHYGSQVKFHKGLYEGRNMQVNCFMMDENGCKGTASSMNLNFPFFNHHSCKGNVDLNVQYDVNGNPSQVISSFPTTFWTYGSVNGFVDFQCQQNALTIHVNDAPRYGDSIYFCAYALMDNGTCWTKTCDGISIHTGCNDYTNNTFDNSYKVFVHEKIVGNTSLYEHELIANDILPNQYIHTWIIENLLYGTKTIKYGNRIEIITGDVYSENIKVCKTIYDLRDKCYLEETECKLLHDFKSANCDSYLVISFDNTGSPITYNPLTKVIRFQYDLGDPSIIPNSTFTFLLNGRIIQPTTSQLSSTTWYYSFNTAITCGKLEFAVYYNYRYSYDMQHIECGSFYMTHTFFIGEEPCLVDGEKLENDNKVNETNQLKIRSLSPNPVIDGNINYEIYSNVPTTATLKIMDVYNHVYETSSIQLIQGSNTKSIRTGTLRPGIYMLHVLNSTGYDSKLFTVR